MGSLKIFGDIKSLLTLEGASKKGGRHIQESDLSIVENAAMVADNKGKIVWLGAQKKLPRQYLRHNKVSLKGRTVLPGFVECHTHSVFAGSRAFEFEMRVQGATYQEISEKGGGIRSTVRLTREASIGSLQTLSQKRVDEFIRQGVTTLEIKSGYGLDFKNEVKLLTTAGKLKGPRIIRTYLGPHSASPETPDFSEYIQKIIEIDLPYIKKKKLAERVDIFVEKGFFSLEMGEKYLKAAKALGFDLTIHAEQLSRTGASLLASRLGARSADHLVQVSPSDVEALAKSETTCVLLPSSDLYMKIPYPPARALLDKGARVALSTDFNPGTSPSQDLSLVGLLARLEMKMTLPEVIAGFTYSAAQALGLHNEIGSLEIGKQADFAVFDCDYRELFYGVGSIQPESVWRNQKNLKKT